MPERLSSMAPFRNATFRSLWIATLASNLGGLIQTVGAGWLMTTLTSSPVMIALVQASNTLPMMLFALPAGALADNFNRRHIMLTAQTFMLLASAGLAIFSYAGLLTPALLLCFTFLIGLGTALNNPSWQASVGDIVPRQDLPAAVALNSMGFNLMRSVGPALGGMIVAIAGAAMAFAINAFSYLPFIYALARWRPDVPNQSLPRESFGRAIAAGLRYVAMSPKLLTVMLRGFIFGFAAVCLLALLPLLARDLVQGGPLAYGVMLGCFGVGAIGGALLNPRLREMITNEWIVRGAFLAYGLAALALGYSTELWVSGLLLLPAGAAWVLSLSLFNVTVQLSTPRWVVGRSMAMYQTATFGGMAAGSAFWGQVAEHFGESEALALSALVMILGAALGLRLALPAFGTQNLDPLALARVPEARLDMRERSGPIMITVEYVLPQENVDAFLLAMTERRRIRIRDGARQWTLMRDLENPDHWFEAYHVATWSDYLRHLQRRTQADYEVTERLQALHTAETPPRVRRMIERQTVPRHDDMPLKAFPDIH